MGGGPSASANSRPKLFLSKASVLETTVAPRLIWNTGGTTNVAPRDDQNNNTVT